MTQINITGKTPSSSPSPDENYAAEYSKRFGLQKGMERFNANMMTRARQEAEYHNKEFDRQKREDDRWFRTYDSAERENFRREQQNTRKWEKLYDQAEREDFNRDRARKRKEDAQWSRDFVATNRESDRRDKAKATADYRAMRYEADQMNRRFDQDRASRSFSGRHGAFMSGHGLGRDLMGRGGLGGIGRAIGASGELGAWEGAGAAIGGGYELLKALYSAPGTLSRALDGMMATAAPYMKFQQGSADIANAGGYSASLMRSSFNNKYNAPDWMKRYGLGPNDALGIYGAYGNRGDYSRDVQRFVSASAMANQTAYLGGLGASTYAAGLGQYETLTGNDYIRPHQYAADANGNPRQDADGGFTNQNPGYSDYFKKMQQAMQQATLYGLDHSKVYSTLNGLFQSQAMSGAASLDISKTSGFWNRMTSGGLASMRDGSGVQAALSGISGAISNTGYGGNSVRNMALNSYFSHHGGMPKTRAGVAKLLGVDLKNVAKGSTDDYMLNSAVSAAQSGNILAFETAIQPFELSNPDFFIKASEDYTSRFTGDRATKDYMAGQISGIGYQGIAAYNSGSGMPVVQVPKFGSISDSVYSDVTAAAKQNNVDPAWLLSIAGQESTFGKNPAERHGLMDVTKPAFDRAKKLGLIPSNWSYADITRDQSKNAMTGAAYLKYQLAKDGGDYSRAIRDYNGGGDPDYLKHVSRFHDTITNANGRQNHLLAANQRLDMNNAEQAYNTASSAFGGPAGDALISFSGNVVEASGAVAQFTTAIQNFLASTGIGRGSNTTHAHTVGRIPNHGQGMGMNAGSPNYSITRYTTMP